MKRRCELSGRQVEALIERLRGRLSAMLPDVQPEIASRLLTLVEDPESGPVDFAKVIQHDPMLSGRLLRAVNSALFAQRNPVTTIERACTLLGLQRIRAIALGFYLSKAAKAGPEDLSRRVWGESVFRACLGGMLGERLVPQRAGEAFLIGLMMDTGIPILRALAGPAYDAVLGAPCSAHERFAMENRTLPCTHVDVASAMCRMWDLPDLLRKPIERHHAPPPKRDPPQDMDLLRRVAFVIGGLDLTIRDDEVEAEELSEDSGALLGLSPDTLCEHVDRAISEYQALIGVFSDVADGLTDLESLRSTVHRRLADAAEEVARTSYSITMMPEDERFAFAGGTVQLDVSAPGRARAILLDSLGEAIVSYDFEPGSDGPSDVLDALGMEPEAGVVFDQFARCLGRIAA